MSNDKKEGVFESSAFNVEGMSCSSCVKKIKKKLFSFNSVKKVKVDLENDSVFVEFDPKKISLEDIQAEIIELGYSINGISDLGETKSGGIKEGLIYGLLPHTGCIAFIIGSILGATFLMNLFRPLLMNRYIFHALIAISIGFATISSFVYLKKNNFLSWKGIKKKWKYLSTMYGLTVGINLLLFFVIFPAVATSSPGSLDGLNEQYSMLNMDVDIPCPGHAPLITYELENIEGVVDVGYSSPENFDVYYDESVTNSDEILSLDVFSQYPATVLSQNSIKEESVDVFSEQDNNVENTNTNSNSCISGCGGCGSCGTPSCGV